jgi:hypothetical protein
MSHMLSFLKRAALAGTVVASMIASAITPALAANPTAVLTFNPASTSVASGATFTVPVQINLQNGASLGDQFGVTYDPAVLTLTGFTDGTWFSNYAATQPAQPNPAQNCTAKHDIDWTPPFPAGVSAIGADHLQGVCAAGASGTGTVVTLNFTAASANTFTTINFTPSDSSGLNTVINGVGFADVTVTPITLKVGTPPAPALAVTGATTTAVTGTPTQFNVSYAIKNNGNLAATDTGNTITVVVSATGTTGGPVTQSVSLGSSGLAAGASTGTQTAGPFTLTGTLGNVTISADSAGAAGGPATGTTSYFFAALSASGTTAINASLAQTIVLTAPANVATGAWVLEPNFLNQFPDGNLGVAANVDFTVTYNDGNGSTTNGFLTEYDGTTLTPAVHLADQLQFNFNGGSSNSTVTGAIQTLVANGLISAEPTAGYAYPVTWVQQTTAGDPGLNAPNYYYETVNFTAAPSGI